MRGDRIDYAGLTAGLPPAAGAHVVNGRGRFLTPGFIDMHGHVSKTRGSSLSLLVAHGITTVRDVGGDHEELLAWRREIDAGRRIGPRLLIAGPYLESASNAARQHATPASELVEPVERTRTGVATPADAERIIAELAARGVDHLKIRATTNRETYLAIGTAARRHGLPLAGHIQPYQLDDVLAAGQASIEHGFYPPLDERPGLDRRALFARLAAAGVPMVPTLVVLAQLCGSPARCSATASASPGPDNLFRWSHSRTDRRTRSRDRQRRPLTPSTASGVPASSR